MGEHELRPFLECEGVTVYWMETAPERRKKLEYRLIERWRPTLNKISSARRRFILEEFLTGIPSEEIFKSRLNSSEMDFYCAMKGMVGK